MHFFSWILTGFWVQVISAFPFDKGLQASVPGRERPSAFCSLLIGGAQVYCRGLNNNQHYGAYIMLPALCADRTELGIPIAVPKQRAGAFEAAANSTRRREVQHLRHV